MLSLHNQTVNVKRLDLIEAMKKGLELHKQQYEEALQDYKQAVHKYLESALDRIELSGDYSDVVLKITPPVLKESDYTDVIEMLEVSVDDTIQLDKESYKAFYKNEWSWTKAFALAASTYKSMIN